ncbi:hypothetical protein [Paenibacillus sp. N3.4]|uniref:hypothetical protein n=1 Tax=Paenibacillus sp. N3.4 TaxID=2603222 RepID=UPI0011C82135|nr:hypothetical protein [Paenibacillus sp. N3.4]TXK70154.1 hypothetical protein FU659_33810 [Paenibacillus sp. N3.4]
MPVISSATILFGSVVAKVAKKLYLEEPLSSLHKKYKMRINENKFDKKKFNNHDLQRGAQRAFIRSVRRICNNCLGYINLHMHEVGNDKEWLVASLEQLEKKLNVELQNVDSLKLPNPPIDVLDELALLLNAQGDMDDSAIQEINQRIIKRALEFDVPHAIYIHEVKGNLFDYMQRYFASEIKFTDEVYNIFTAQLEVESNLTIKQVKTALDDFIGDIINELEEIKDISNSNLAISTDSNKKLDQVIEILSQTELVQIGIEEEQIPSNENFIIEINHDNQLVKTDGELYFLLEEMKDYAKNHGKIHLKVHVLYKEDFKRYCDEAKRELETKFKSIQDFNALKRYKRKYKFHKDNFEDIQDRERLAENMILYLLTNNSLSYYRAAADNLLSSFKSVISFVFPSELSRYVVPNELFELFYDDRDWSELSPREQDFLFPKMQEKKLKLQCYTANEEHPTFAIDLNEEQHNMLTEEQRLTYKIGRYNFICELPIQIILKTVIPKFLATLDRSYNGNLELKEDEVFNNIDIWYFSLS